MRRLLIITPFLFLFHFIFHAQDVSWYKCLAGTIDKYPITLHLHKWGNQYAGYYYYNSRQEPVYFIGDDTTEAGNIKLRVFLPDRETEETFVFSIDSNTAAGEWHTTGRAKALSFFAKEEKNTALVFFDFVFTEGDAVLRPSFTESPRASYEAASVWPQGNSVKVNFIKKMIGGEFGEKNLQQDIGKLLLKNKKELLDGYLQENKDVKDDEIKEMGFSLNVEETNYLLAVYQSPKLLTTAHLSYTYTGGAHGNFGTSYTSIDLAQNKKLKLTDIITATGKTKLSGLLEKYFRRTYKLKPTDKLTEILFENKIEANDNFYLTGRGIGFCYMPYEIAAYAMGEINVFIPFTELSAYLQPGFKKLISTH